jgi:hypothetical protein
MEHIKKEFVETMKRFCHIVCGENFLWVGDKLGGKNLILSFCHSSVNHGTIPSTPFSPTTDKHFPPLFTTISCVVIVKTPLFSP